MIHHAIAVSLALGASWITAPQNPHPASDTRNIEWVLPGQFEKAQEQAHATQRMILIKGISFGVDGLGAQCATKGRW